MYKISVNVNQLARLANTTDSVTPEEMKELNGSSAIVSVGNMVWRNLCLGQKAKSYKKNMEYKRGNSWKAKLKYNVDRAIWSSISFDEFLMKMTESGYEIRKGKYLAFRAPGQKHFTNVKTLGAYYAEDSILRRLEKNRHKVRILFFKCSYSTITSCFSHSVTSLSSFALFDFMFIIELVVN